MWLFMIFVALPLIEIALFIQVGGLIGLWPTLALVLAAAVIGTAIMRGQGANALIEVQRAFAEMRDPSRPLAHGMMIMIAGILLVIPGFFTDFLGLLLLIPPVRRALLKNMASRVEIRRAGPARDPHRPPYGDGVIDGDYVVEDEPLHPTPPRPDLPPPDGRGGSGWTRH